MAPTPGTCFLSRDFGPRAGQLYLAAVPGQAAMEMTLVLPKGTQTADGEAVVRLSPGEDQIAKSVTQVMAKGSRPALRFMVGASVRKRIDGAGRLTVDAGDMHLAFDLMPSAGISAAFDRCMAGVVQTWGIDPAVLIPGDEVGGLGKYFQWNDYLGNVVNSGQRGLVTALVEVDGSGDAKSCRTLDSSGFVALDAQTCHAAMRIKGLPRAGWISVRARWDIARD